MLQYNYSKLIKIPDHTPSNKIPGNQILHFSSTNHPIVKNKSTFQYVNTHMSRAKKFDSDAEILKYAIESIRINSGLIMEFGVGAGRTTNFIAALNPKKVIYGFDSFKGLPDDWACGLTKGTFALVSDELPPLLDNIALHIGMFEETLPQFILNYLNTNTQISLIHIDCDLYRSTETIFRFLGDYITSGTIIHFDEYYNYDGWKLHEHKAFQEFISNKKLKYE